jgi:hypothetical protein
VQRARRRVWSQFEATGPFGVAYAHGWSGRVLGRVDEVVIDCVEPREVASFWAAVLGGEVQERDPDWWYVVHRAGHSSRQ